jgi:kumamolisin
MRVLERRLRAAGLGVTGAYPQRTELDVSGTAATVERLFRVRLERYRDAAGDRYHAPLASPSLPASLLPFVTAVTGLDTRPMLTTSDVPEGGVTPALAATAYDVAALHAAGIDGQGERIAVIAFSVFDAHDPAAFAKSYRLPGPAPKVIPVDGGATDTSVGGEIETNLDLDVIHAIAPDAQILVYEAPNRPGAYADVINRIVANRQATIISSSWGECEPGTALADRLSEEEALRSAVSAGITMFVAAGDAGAYDCQDQDPADHRLSVDWPAASAYAVAVGGTRLYVAPDGGYLRETAWNDQLSDSGGGGGFSATEPRPSWQRGPGVIEPNSNGNRQLPDVSAAADPATGWATYVNGAPIEVGGTSAATPFWAASMLLVAQYAKAQGAGPLGFIDPLLYALAASRQPYQPFHVITVGTNRYYHAARGWNPATGLGSPSVWNLARDIISYLRGTTPR